MALQLLVVIAAFTGLAAAPSDSGSSIKDLVSSLASMRASQLDEFDLTVQVLDLAKRPEWPDEATYRLVRKGSDYWWRTSTVSSEVDETVSGDDDVVQLNGQILLWSPGRLTADLWSTSNVELREALPRIQIFDYGIWLPEACDSCSPFDLAAFAAHAATELEFPVATPAPVQSGTFARLSGALPDGQAFEVVVDVSRDAIPVVVRWGGYEWRVTESGQIDGVWMATRILRANADFWTSFDSGEPVVSGSSLIGIDLVQGTEEGKLASIGNGAGVALPQSFDAFLPAGTIVNIAESGGYYVVRMNAIDELARNSVAVAGVMEDRIDCSEQLPLEPLSRSWYYRLDLLAAGLAFAGACLVSMSFWGRVKSR